MIVGDLKWVVPRGSEDHMMGWMAILWTLYTKSSFSLETHDVLESPKSWSVYSLVAEITHRSTSDRLHGQSLQGRHGKWQKNTEFVLARTTQAAALKTWQKNALTALKSIQLITRAARYTKTCARKSKWQKKWKITPASESTQRTGRKWKWISKKENQNKE